MDRVLPSEGRSRRFKSRREYHFPPKSCSISPNIFPKQREVQPRLKDASVEFKQDRNRKATVIKVKLKMDVKETRPFDILS